MALSTRHDLRLWTFRSCETINPCCCQAYPVCGAFVIVNLGNSWVKCLCVCVCVLEYQRSKAHIVHKATLYRTQHQGRWEEISDMQSLCLASIMLIISFSISYLPGTPYKIWGVYVTEMSSTTGVRSAFLWSFSCICASLILEKWFSLSSVFISYL